MSDAKLKQRIKETKEHMNLNYQRDGDEDYEFTDEDAIEDLMGECGKTPDGYCSMAGSEYCDFECPFSG